MNVKGVLLLSMSNCFEVVVGYVMMDGDISGGFLLFVGIDKVFLFVWLDWMEIVGF